MDPASENRSAQAQAQAKGPKADRKFVAILASPVLHLQLLIVLAIWLGGGGVAYGFRNLAIQLTALAVLALNAPLVMRFLREGPRPLQLLAGLTLLLPLMQLVPLPPQVWQGLPGRELLGESYAIAGIAGERWVPVSVNPMRTLVAFCASLVPATVIAVGSLLRIEQKLLLVWALIAATFAALCLGVAQVGSANSFGLLFEERTVSDVLYATFANRNSTALLFVITLCLMAGFSMPRQQAVMFALVPVSILLFIGTILTQSRTGMVLLVLPVGILALRGVGALLGRRPGPRGRVGQPAIWLSAAAVTLVVVAVGASATMGGRAADSFARFNDTQTDRPEMWEDGLYAAGQYWPLGSGTGSFDDVFQLHESLEYVSPRRAGRAHNDYVELSIESGLIGIALAAAWLAWCGFAALRPAPDSTRWLRLGAGAGVAAIALQSLLDYPLRSQTLLCVAGVLVILLVRTREYAR
ncbi:O-antigen ligase family protein [Aurantiacibacter odishensis]|uniref:O-antigen ligase family protein n=1 Tax=Aurantiacibacter odishensis TaxID=1155476 RepID=UPI000E73DA54|nr:O-antigen ligase family protein [Aurantiacibacter odishensis]